MEGQEVAKRGKKRRQSKRELFVAPRFAEYYLQRPQQRYQHLHLCAIFNFDKSDRELREPL